MFSHAAFSFPEGSVTFRFCPLPSGSDSRGSLAARVPHCDHNAEVSLRILPTSVFLPPTEGCLIVRLQPQDGGQGS